jgi:hypothetical protein
MSDQESTFGSNVVDPGLGTDESDEDDASCDANHTDDEDGADEESEPKYRRMTAAEAMAIGKSADDEVDEE